MLGLGLSFGLFSVDRLVDAQGLTRAATTGRPCPTRVFRVRVARLGGRCARWWVWWNWGVTVGQAVEFTF